MGLVIFQVYVNEIFAFNQLSFELFLLNPTSDGAFRAIIISQSFLDGHLSSHSTRHNAGHMQRVSPDSKRTFNEKVWS